MVMFCSLLEHFFSSCTHAQMKTTTVLILNPVLAADSEGPKYINKASQSA